MTQPSQKLYEKFFSDPDWHLVEKMIMDYVNPLIEMSDIDENQPAEHVKAELIGRKKIHRAMTEFLEQAGIVKQASNYQNKNIFK